MRPYALLTIICFAPSLLSAQSKPGAQDATTLTVDGQPDIQGLWTNSTTTPLERPTALGDQASYSNEELSLIHISEPTRPY